MSELKLTQENQELIGLWKSLAEHPAWVKMVEVAKTEIEKADLIINQIGGDRDLEFSKRDLAIVKKNFYLTLIETPTGMMNQLSGTGVEEVEEMDPFDKEKTDETEAPTGSVEDF